MKGFSHDEEHLLTEYSVQAHSKNKDDLLIETNVMTRMNYKLLSNHLHHHWMVTLICASSALTAIGAFVVGLLLIIIK